MARLVPIIDAGVAREMEEGFPFASRLQPSAPTVQSIRVWVWREAWYGGAQWSARLLRPSTRSNAEPTVYEFPGPESPRLVNCERTT